MNARIFPARRAGARIRQRWQVQSRQDTVGRRQPDLHAGVRAGSLQRPVCRRAVTGLEAAQRPATCWKVITLSAGSLADFGQTGRGAAWRRARRSRPGDRYLVGQPLRARSGAARRSRAARRPRDVARHVVALPRSHEPALRDYLARLRRHVDVLRPAARSRITCVVSRSAARSSRPVKSAATTTSRSCATASRAIKTRSARRCSSRTRRRRNIRWRVRSSSSTR